jgi:putative hemolysin
MAISLQLVLLILCVSGASFFAGSETGFVSWNPLKLAHRAASGNIRAKWALFLMDHKDRLLSAVLIGNNICVVGASLAFAVLFEEIDHRISWNLAYLPSPESWLLTPFMVLFGEMLPKSLFRIYPFRLTMRSTPLLIVVYFATLPFTVVFSALTGLMFRQRHERGDSYMTKVREEMILVALEGSRAGTLFRSADIFIQNVLAMNEKRVMDVCTFVDAQGTKAEVMLFTEDQTAEEVRKRIKENAGMLVTKKDGEIAGCISLLDLANMPTNKVLGEACTPLPQLRSDQTILSALRQINESSSSFFLVTNSKGKRLGVVETGMLLQNAFHNKD